MSDFGEDCEEFVNVLVARPEEKMGKLLPFRNRPVNGEVTGYKRLDKAVELRREWLDTLDMFSHWSIEDGVEP